MAQPLCTLLTSAGLFLVAVALAAGERLRWPALGRVTRYAPRAMLALLLADAINGFAVLQAPQLVSIAGWTRFGLSVVATALLAFTLIFSPPLRAQSRWLDRLPPTGRWGLFLLSLVVCIDLWQWLWPGLLTIATVAGSALAAIVLAGALTIGVGAIWRHHREPARLAWAYQLPLDRAARAQGVIMSAIPHIPRPTTQTMNPAESLPRIPKRWKIGLALAGLLFLLTRPTFVRSAPAARPLAAPAAASPWSDAVVASSDLSDLQQQRTSLLARLAAVDRAIAGQNHSAPAPTGSAPIGAAPSAKSADSFLAAVEAAWANRPATATNRPVETVDLSQYGTTDVKTAPLPRP